MKATLIIKAPNDVPFKEAFRFARNKGGSDALFEWKGKRYTTLFEGESTWDELYKKYKDKKNKGKR